MKAELELEHIREQHTTALQREQTFEHFPDGKNKKKKGEVIFDSPVRRGLAQLGAKFEVFSDRSSKQDEKKDRYQTENDKQRNIM